MVLLGDATYDPKNYLGAPARNHVPSMTVRSSHIWTASDPSFALVNGNDPLPDLAIGRLPAGDVIEARALVEKIVAWENAGLDLDSGPAV